MATTVETGWLKNPETGKKFAPITMTNKVLMANGQPLDENLSALSNTIASNKSDADKKIAKLLSTKNVTIPTSGWSSSAPYTQDVAVNGITASDMPEVYLYYPDSINASNAEAYVEAYGYINKVVTGAGKITVTAFYEKPSVDVTVMLKGV